ncbi:hypothetical protein VNI00_015660 [Paramarasmius palmivorus]|uniref:Uncharacterized protein n=1 Tax=Paramarasmius palmivorus TaxID=297713 RepID=A0AAW0BKG7_9AGAR
MAAAPKLPRLAISSSSTSLSSCTPNLMPFSIDYNGTAPISTFFHVEDAKRNRAEKMKEQDSQDIIVAEEEPSKPPTQHNQKTFPNDLCPHFAGELFMGLRCRYQKGLRACFSGLTATKKTGGGGMLTKAKEKAKSAMKRKGKKSKSIEEDEEPSSSRTTRRSARRASAIDVDAEDEDMKAPSDDDGFPEDQEPHKTTTLDASMQFSSFVLWHPDIPVDTGKDEYFGTISEWMKVAQAINHIED